MNLKSRISQLEERLDLLPNSVELTLENGRRIRINESRLRAIFEQGIRMLCPDWDGSKAPEPSRTLTAAEIASIPGMRDVLQVVPPNPPIVAGIKLLTTGPFGHYTGEDGVDRLNQLCLTGMVIRVTFVEPEPR